jgi:protocatechuate 3,4-dioxygenase beta subunit
MGATSRNPWHEGIKVREGQTTENVDFEVSARRSEEHIVLRLLKPDGVPLAGASGRISMDFLGNNRQASFGGTFQTDKEGRYRLKDYGEGVYRLALTVEGYRPVRRTFHLRANQSPPEITIRLEPLPPGGLPRGSISGRVFLPDGRTPAAGVWVFPYKKNEPLPGANVGWGGKDRYRLTTKMGTITDEEGRFVIHGLLPGRYGVLASPFADFSSRTPLRQEWETLLPALSEVVEVRPNQETKGLRLVLEQGGTLTGTVRDAETGAPIANAWVNASTLGGPLPPFPWSMLSAYTDAQGRYRIAGIPAGSYRVLVSAQGYQSILRGNVRIRKGRKQTLDFRLKRK